MIAVLCFMFMSHYSSQCFCYVPLPNTFDPHNLEISCSIFVSYLLSYLAKQNKQLDFLNNVHRSAVGCCMPVESQDKVRARFESRLCYWQELI